MHASPLAITLLGSLPMAMALKGGWKVAVDLLAFCKTQLGQIDDEVREVAKLMAF